MILKHFKSIIRYFPMERCQPVLNFIDHNKLYLAGGAMSIVSLFLMFYNTRDARKDFENAVSVSKLNGGTSILIPEKHSSERILKVKRSRIPKTPSRLEPQSIAGVNTNLTDLLQSVARKNVYEFWAPSQKTIGPDGEPVRKMVRFGFAIAVRGTTLLLPYHFISELSASCYEDHDVSGEDMIEFRKFYAHEISFAMSVDEFFKCWTDNPRKNDFEKHEVAFVKLPRHFPPVRDITHLFVDRKALDIYNYVDVVLSIPFSVTTGKQMPELFSTQARFSPKVDVDATGYEPYSVTDVWTYRARTNAGDCGSVLFVDDTRKSPKIIGFHIAGITAKQVGYSSVLSKELVEEICSAAGEKYVIVDQMKLELTPANDLSNKEALGRVQPQYASSANGKTKIIKSVLHGSWKRSAMEPARLKPFINEFGERVDPMLKANVKYCLNYTWIDPVDLENAKQSLADMLRSCSPRFVPKQIYSFETAILGDDSGFFKAIPRVTSAGFPYTSQKGKQTKERFFGSDDDYNLNLPECIELKRVVDELIDYASRGVRLTHVFVDCLKDERRSLKKVQAGDTRMFSASPTPLLIVSRMYFGAFQRWICANSIDNGIAITVNEYSTDWDYIARKLKSKGPEVGAGDFKSFDAREMPVIHYQILDIINDWYGDQASNEIRRVIWYEIVNSLHLNRDIIYSWSSSLASGHALTIFVNCLYNHMCFRLVWMQLKLPPSGFNENIYLIVTGDDHVYNPSPKTGWTERLVQDRMNNMGMTYTPEDKNKVECDKSMRRLEDVTFLKRKFVWDSARRRYIAPLDLDVVLEIPFWVKDGASSLGDTEVNLNIALEELSLHPKEVFEYWSKEMLKAVYDTGVLQPPTDTVWTSLRQRVLSREEGSDRLSESYCTNLSSRLRGVINEYCEENFNVALEVSRSRDFHPYCQDGTEAALPISRIHNPSSGLIEPQSGNKSIAATNTTTKHVSFVPGQDLGSTSVTNVSEESVSSFPNYSTADATNDGVIKETNMIKHIPLTSGHLDSANTGVTQQVSVFLSKPYLLSSGNFATTDAFATSNYFQSRIYHTVVTGNSVWYNKLSGNYVTRGTLVFTLFVNANRFQQGRYIMAWCPDGGAAQNSATFVAGHSAKLTQVTQLPHVEVDLSMDTQAVLHVPFVNATGWNPLTVATPALWDIGSLMIRAYSPLVAPAGSTTASWSLYVHMEDVQFKMPVVPQSRGGARSKVIRRIPVAEKEASSDTPVSSFLSKVSTIAGNLSSVPLLSSIAAPVSWATGVAASVAAAFGWSKPAINSPFIMIARYIFPKYNNADSHDTTFKLAVMDSNCVEDMVGFSGSDLDEMSLSFIASIPAWFSTINWTTAQAAGTAITSVTMSPRAYVQTSTYGANTVYFPAPVSYIANFFSEYRGSLRLTVKIVKTEFHSGRLALSFYPFDYLTLGASPAAPTLSQSEYLHREIIDVRNGNEFTFIIPYTSILPYRPLFGNDAPYGTIYFHVLNPLIAPATVSSTVTLLFEISAAEDMEFAYPRTIQEQIVYPITPQSGSTRAQVDDLKDMYRGLEALNLQYKILNTQAIIDMLGTKIEDYRQRTSDDIPVEQKIRLEYKITNLTTQLCFNQDKMIRLLSRRDQLEPMGTVEPQSGNQVSEIVSTEIGNSSISESLIPSRMCIGERVMSLRQLIKRYNTLVQQNAGASQVYFQALPFSVFVNVITAANALNAPEVLTDIYSTIISCFALARGSVRYKVLDAGDPVNHLIGMRNLPLSLSSPSISANNFKYVAASPATFGGFGNGDNNTLTYSGITAGLEIDYPFYSRSFAYPVADVSNNAAVDLSYSYSSTAPRTQMYITWDAAPQATTFFRAAGEDFHAGLFVSVPGFLSWNNQVS
jgi:hypothetical protein